MTDYSDEEPLARWEALLLPDWTWEAYEKEDEEEGLYFGRVKSPNTYGKWEYGYFSQEQLEEAGAYRVDTSIEDGELFPDGGIPEDLAEVYETELAALDYLENELETEEDERWFTD
jgi:hypothetical protein